MIETYLLEAFIAFAEYGTVSAASEHLMISQPSLSRSLKKLEDTLNVPLFSRTKNTLTLNENGEFFVKEAKKIIKVQQNAISNLHQFYNQRTITIGMSIPGPRYIFQQALKDIYPSSTITFQLDEFENLLTTFLSESENLYDFLFVHKPIEIKGYQCVPCAKEHLKLAVLPANPIASYTDGITFDMVDGQTFLQHKPVGYWNDIVRQNLPHSHIIYQTDQKDLAELVNNSSLPTFVTNLTNMNSQPYQGRIAIDFLDESAYQTFYFVYPTTKKREVQPLLETFDV